MNTGVKIYFLIVAVLLSPFSAIAAAPNAGDTVVSAFNNIQAVVASEQDDTRLRGAVLPQFDFKELSRRCTGQAWNKASSGEQEEFSGHFRELLARGLLGTVRSMICDWKIEVASESSNGDRAKVNTVLTSAKDTAKAQFWLVRENGSWRIHNVVIGAFSLEKIYQGQFQKFAESNGMSSLLSRLRVKQ